MVMHIIYILCCRCATENGVTDENLTCLHLQFRMCAAPSRCWFNVFSPVSEQMSSQDMSFVSSGQRLHIRWLGGGNENVFVQCICVRAVYGVPAMATLKCCGGGNSWIIQSFTCFFAQCLWNAVVTWAHSVRLLPFCLLKLALWDCLEMIVKSKWDTYYYIWCVIIICLPL